MIAYKAEFSSDLIEGKEYTGYSLDETWNGWECPYFMPEEMERIISDFNKGNAPITNIYCESDGNYYMDDIPSETSHELIACPYFINTEDGVKKLYQFNGFTWYKEEEE